VSRALAKAPDDRFPTCGALAAALSASLAGGVTLERTRELAALQDAPAEPPPAAPPPPARPRRLGRRLSVAVALLAGAAAGAAAVVFGFERQPDEQFVTETQTRTVGRAAGEPNDFERELLRRIPAAFRDTCVPIEPIAAGFDSTVRCRPGEGVVRAEYSHARSGDVMQDHFRDRVVMAGIELSEDAGLPKEGVCGEPEPSVREWTARGRTGHAQTDSFELEQLGYDTAERQRLLGGHFLCHRQRGRYWVEWTDQPTGIYALATGPSADAVVGWWKVAAGSVAPP
jgi:hypothetical protein